MSPWHLFHCILPNSLIFSAILSVFFSGIIDHSFLVELVFFFWHYLCSTTETLLLCFFLAFYLAIPPAHLKKGLENRWITPCSTFFHTGRSFKFLNDKNQSTYKFVHKHIVHILNVHGINTELFTNLHCPYEDDTTLYTVALSTVQRTIYSKPFEIISEYWTLM